MTSSAHDADRKLARGATRRLAEFAVSLKFEDLPPDVVEKAKLCLLDHLGCAVYGASLSSMRRVLELVEGEGGAPHATILGSRLRTGAALAALANGTSAHAFQLDEIHIESTLHAGSLAFPAAIALGETRGATSGAELITAAVAGYEVGIRAGLAARGGMFQRGFHNQGTSGVFVAAAAAARMLRLNAEAACHALGIAGSQAAGLMAVQDGAMTKSFHSGRAAQSGVYGAILAAKGYTGIPDVLDGDYGTFFSAFLADWAPAALTEGLGAEWAIRRVGFKPAPASNGSITAMTAIDTIMREHALTAADIAAVTAYVSENTLHHCGWPYAGERIQSVLSAQMNLRYGLAVMALERAAGVEQFAEDKIRDPRLLAFVERVSVEHEPRFEGQNGRYRVACRLVVRARAGAEYETIVPYRRGSPEDPMSDADLVAKFNGLAARLGERQKREAIDAIGALDKAPDLGRLTVALALPPNLHPAV
jgi:2-methylcitrate dehydratase PrpD